MRWSRGAACLVVHRSPTPCRLAWPARPRGGHDPALGRLGAGHRASFAVPVAPATGSAGKTTTKELIAAGTATRWPVHEAEASFNNQWGLPLTLLRLGPEHRRPPSSWE